MIPFEVFLVEPWSSMDLSWVNLSFVLQTGHVISSVTRSCLIYVDLIRLPLGSGRCCSCGALRFGIPSVGPGSVKVVVFCLSFYARLGRCWNGCRIVIFDDQVLRRLALLPLGLNESLPQNCLVVRCGLGLGQVLLPRLASLSYLEARTPSL